MVPSNDSKVCSILAGGSKVLFPGGRGHTIGAYFCQLELVRYYRFNSTDGSSALTYNIPCKPQTGIELELLRLHLLEGKSRQRTTSRVISLSFILL